MGFLAILAGLILLIYTFFAWGIMVAFAVLISIMPFLFIGLILYTLFKFPLEIIGVIALIFLISRSMFLPRKNRKKFTNFSSSGRINFHSHSNEKGEGGDFTNADVHFGSDQYCKSRKSENANQVWRDDPCGRDRKIRTLQDCDKID